MIYVSFIILIESIIINIISTIAKLHNYFYINDRMTSFYYKNSYPITFMYK